MPERILVPVDGSAFAEQALPHAVALAQATGAQLHVVIVHEIRPIPNRAVVLGSELIEAQRREFEEQYMEELPARLRRERGVEVETAVLSGTAAEEIAGHAARLGIDLIVMSTHGRGGLSRSWLGSVADGVVRSSGVPVLLVRPDEASGTATAPAFRRVLVAVDGSETAEAALRQAAALCRATGAACSVIRVVVPPDRVIAGRLSDTAGFVHDRTEAEEREAESYLHALLERTDHLPDGTRAEVVTGYRTAEAILGAAAAEGADIIAVGTRGFGGAARLLLGSVADKVIRGADGAVLVCPPWKPPG